MREQERRTQSTPPSSIAKNCHKQDMDANKPVRSPLRDIEGSRWANLFVKREQCLVGLCVLLSRWCRVARSCSGSLRAKEHLNTYLNVCAQRTLRGTPGKGAALGVLQRKKRDFTTASALRTTHLLASGELQGDLAGIPGNGSSCKRWRSSTVWSATPGNA